MKYILQAVSFLVLGAMLALPCLFFMDRLSLPALQNGLLACSVAWFATAPFWKTGRA